jgi:ABC-type branched-subunit amino acid transport system ATPase component/ABC-type branched-subunit amino acid transport system permease subunit
VVLLVYFATDLIAAWGLNLQYGVAGVLNFGYIAIVAVGAYTYGVLTLGSPASNGNFEKYVVGIHLGAGYAFVLVILMGCVFGGVVGLIGRHRLRPDYQAIMLLVVAAVALAVAGADTGLVNGNPGLSLLPNPLGTTGPTAGNGWAYVGILFGICIVCYFILRRFSDGPLGRSLRAVRDDPDAALAIGKNVVGLRLLVQVVGGGFGALAGALLAAFIGAWAPSAWQFAETLSLLTAVIVGGVASNYGVVAGVLLVPVILEQLTQYVPGLNTRPQLAADIGWMVTSALTIIFIWWRPGGLLPDRRPRYGNVRRSRFSYAPQPALLAAAGVGSMRVAEAGEDRAGEVGSGAPVLGADRGTGAGALPALPALVARRAASSVEPGGSLLTVTGMVVRFGGVRAVDGVSLEAAAGRITGLIGPNGAGKSTLVNAVTGFVRPESGRVEFNGIDLSREQPHRRARVGLVRTFQLARQFPRLTVMENLLVGRQSHPAETALGVLAGVHFWRRVEEENVERAYDLLRSFELSTKANVPATNLSGGERRMVEIMRALMADPMMLVLDEPLAGLSPRWAERLEDIVLRLQASGIGFLLIEHELGIIERLCQSVVVMARGSVLSVGTMEELRAQPEVQAAYVMG